MNDKKEIQWIAVKHTEELEVTLQQMIQFMIAAKQDIVTFFLDYEEDGYMIEAYEDFDWFEVTNAKRPIGYDGSDD